MNNGANIFPVVVDLVPLYPRTIASSDAFALFRWYVKTYGDPLQTGAAGGAWFQLFLCLEATVHVPLSFWLVIALYNGS